MNGEQLLSALVAIDSVNPDLVAGGAGEAEIAALVADWLRDGAIATPGLTRAPFAVDPGGAIVTATSRAAQRITGAAPDSAARELCA